MQLCFTSSQKHYMHSAPKTIPVCVPEFNGQRRCSERSVAITSASVPPLAGEGLKVIQVEAGISGVLILVAVDFYRVEHPRHARSCDMVPWQRAQSTNQKRRYRATSRLGICQAASGRDRWWKSPACCAIGIHLPGPAASR